MKLIYVKQWGMGRAELSRLILAHVEADFEDCRIDQEEFKELQPCKYTIFLGLEIVKTREKFYTRIFVYNFFTSLLKLL